MSTFCALALCNEAQFVSTPAARGVASGLAVPTDVESGSVGCISVRLIAVQNFSQIRNEAMTQSNNWLTVQKR